MSWFALHAANWRTRVRWVLPLYCTHSHVWIFNTSRAWQKMPCLRAVPIIWVFILLLLHCVTSPWGVLRHAFGNSCQTDTFQEFEYLRFLAIQKLYKTKIQLEDINYLRDWMHWNFVTLAMCLLNSRIVGVFVRYEVCGFDVATVWILTFAVENLFVQFDVVVVDGIVKSDCDHHWYIFCLQASWDGCSIFGAEAIRQ